MGVGEGGEGQGKDDSKAKVAEWPKEVRNGSTPDFWGRGPGLESSISHNDPGALQDHCVIL